MKLLNSIQFGYKRAFRLSLLLNVVLIIMAIVVVSQLSVSAATLQVTGKTQGTTTYKLNLGLNQVVYVHCNTAYGGEARLRYLSNQQALTCPS